MKNTDHPLVKKLLETNQRLLIGFIETEQYGQANECNGYASGIMAFCLSKMNEEEIEQAINNSVEECRYSDAAYWKWYLEGFKDAMKVTVNK